MLFIIYHFYWWSCWVIRVSFWMCKTIFIEQVKRRGFILLVLNIWFEYCIYLVKEKEKINKTFM